MLSPCSDWVLPFALFLSLLCCLVPFALSLLSFSPPFRLCVCCHSIVGLVLCFCDRVVSLWNGGVGLCWVEGRAVCTVYTSSVCGVHLSVCVVMAVCDDSVCLVVLCCGLWVVEWRWCEGVGM